MEKKTILNNTITSAYLLLLSVAYLWGFWGHFDINILNFIGVSDIIKSVIWPMTIALVMYIVQVALNVFNGPKPKSTTGFSTKTKHEKIITIIEFSYMTLILLIALAGVAYSLISGTKMQKYAAIGWILSSVLYFTTYKNREIMEYFPFKNKSFIYCLVCFLPVLFLSNGVYQGNRITTGIDTFLIESNSTCTSNDSNKYRYIDAVGDKAFALSLKDNSVCIFKYEYLKLIKEQQPTNK